MSSAYGMAIGGFTPCGVGYRGIRDQFGIIVLTESGRK